MRIATNPSTNPGDYAFRHRLRVRFSETDAMGIVHHSRYLPYLEEARVEYLRHIGHPYHEIRETGIDMAVLEAHVRYRRPLLFDDLVDVHVTMGDVTRATFQMTYLLTVDDEIRSTAITAHGALTHDGRATRLPEWFRSFASGADAT